MLNLEEAPRSPYAGALPGEQLLDEIRDIRTVEVASNFQVGYTMLNRHRLGEASAVVAIGSFMSDLTTADRANEGAHLATLNRPVLMLDLPGHGLSSPHTRSQTADLCIRRKADSEAAPLADAVQKLLPPTDKLDYFGISHGSFMALKATELDPHDRVDSVFGLDIPAVKKRHTLGLQAGYIVTDNIIGRKKYLRVLKDTDIGTDFDSFKAAYEKAGPQRAKSFIQRNTGLFVLNLVASINARPGALESWNKIMETKQTRVAAVTSENGSISDPMAIAEFIQGLPPSQKVRSSQVVVPGEDHNIGITHLMPRAVAWAEAAFNTYLD